MKGQAAWSGKKGRVLDMYRKFVMKLFLCHMLILTSWICVMAIQSNKLASAPAFQVKAEQDEEEIKADRSFGRARKVTSGQRVVDYAVMEKKYKYSLSETDYEVLLKIVQAEAGNEDEEGKMLVAGVVLNRVDSSRFPNTVSEVVMQHENGVYQFSPVANGTYQRVKVSSETVYAVEKVLMGEDLTGGALYFAARKSADPEKMKWFDRSLTKLFEHGGHEFFING